MRTIQEVKAFYAAAFHKYVDRCEKCEGIDMDCECRRKTNFMTACYESCIPKDFWYIKPESVNHNRTAFDGSVLPYVKSMNKALRRGYGLLFLGDNGAGKTYFISFILTEAIKRGRTAYFTTMPDLDWYIKRSFNDNAVATRLEEMLTSDFVAIDELGKERAKNSNVFMDAQVERMMKRRIDDCQPMLLSCNMEFGELNTAYGPTVSSMLNGKFQQVHMEPGDYREILHKEMTKEMGYR
jgi:DNA replication protein DnaC